jgi:DHA2 family multidrug resistance protein-like MFS transporter
VTDDVPAAAGTDAAEAARDTLGGAVAAGDQLPDPLAAELLDAAREAFTQGVQVTAAASAVVAAGTAALAAVLLRHVRTGSESPVDPGLEAVPWPASSAPE